jgi:hypothetical protein
MLPRKKKEATKKNNPVMEHGVLLWNTISRHNVLCHQMMLVSMPPFHLFFLSISHTGSCLVQQLHEDQYHISY